MLSNLSDYPAFLERLQAGCGARSPALAVVDLEGLGDIDAALGYDVTDRLLRQAGEALATALPGGFVGMTGRHQLACMLPHVDGSGFAELAGHKMLRVLGEPFPCGEREVLLWPRVGLALSRGGRAVAPPTLLAQACAAMRKARRERVRLRLHAPDAAETMLEGVDLWSQLGDAIEEGALHLEYQPQIALASGRVESAEALLRWDHPEYGAIRPDTMVRAAEGTDLMPRLTHWVFNTALRQCAEYRQAGLGVGVSVNFSADDLQEPEVVDLVAQSLDLWGVPPEQVTIELTETAVMESHDATARDALHSMKGLGLRLSMDDFGIGYSSMERLLRMPLDELKIDMTFVHELSASPPHQRIVESMVGLGHKLGLTVVAEGVEDEDTLTRLRALDCDLVQGFYLGRPARLGYFMEQMLRTRD
ncbi:MULTISPECIES: bifunctional diguanylate cyclase/phosphodiesterase [unclassified Thioalkalivibrio]|uniref:putative bifunctional diguanylate cyclase/phosphodiesterase n=1 Tax=unclassified Thioalkalivibrio TaxID=2621013 RepID=UPI000379EE11|nr:MULTISPECIES: GGDEF domain-containing phosphodiesterase [unclassified Thioalkalivibrio]